MRGAPGAALLRLAVDYTVLLILFFLGLNHSYAGPAWLMAVYALLRTVWTCSGRAKIGLVLVQYSVFRCLAIVILGMVMSFCTLAVAETLSAMSSEMFVPIIVQSHTRMSHDLLIVGIATIGLLVGQVAAEEIVFRGLILARLIGVFGDAKRGNATGVVCSAVLFGFFHAIHWPTSVVILATGFGMLTGFMRLRTRSLVPGFFLHLGWNMVYLPSILYTVASEAVDAYPAG